MRDTMVESKGFRMALKTHVCPIHKTSYVQDKCPYCQHGLMNDDWE
jgi:hypothetical protein